MHRLLILISTLLVASCMDRPRDITIPFAVKWQGESIHCEQPVDGVHLLDMRFYVQDLAVIDAEGRTYPVHAVPDDIWQNESVVLIDLENGQGSCVNGSEAMNASFAGRVSAAEFVALEFRIGVPETLNHEDPLRAGAPLSYTDMHWHWASGYKFMRAGVETASDSTFLHLGSSRCEGTIGDIKGCASDNRPYIVRQAFSEGEQSIEIDLAVLFGADDLTDGERTECMSGPAEAHCSSVFSALGLDFASGESTRSPEAIQAGSIR